MVSGLVIAEDETPYFSRLKNDSRAIGNKRLSLALVAKSFHDKDWRDIPNYHIMPDQLLEWDK